MRRFQPLVRVGLIGSSLMAASCSSGESLGLDASDPNCVLLCALTRSLSGDQPKPPPQPPSAPVPPKPPVAHHAARVRLTRPPMKSVAPKPAEEAPTPSPAATTPAAPAPAPDPVPPQSPVSAQPPAAPVAPPQSALPSPQGLGQSIPGSATIVEPLLQTH